jgi:hypothetical protein
MIGEDESMKNAPTVAVLLVGDNARNSPILQDHLRRRGGGIFFATSCKEAQKILEERHYDLVLSEFLLSDGTAYQLVPCLRGTDTTMFFSNAVEDGCWWLNAVFEGEDRTEEPGMHPRSSESSSTKSCSTGLSGIPMNLCANPVRIAATICPLRFARNEGETL